MLAFTTKNPAHQIVPIGAAVFKDGIGRHYKANGKDEKLPNTKRKNYDKK